MQNVKTRKLVLTGILLALMLALHAMGIDIIPIPPTGVTILHVPVIIGTLVGGLYVGMPLALAFGLLSMYKAYITPIALNICFLNPAIAVLPRLMIPLITFALMKIIKYDEFRPSLFKTSLCALCGSLTNTVLVLGLIGFFYGDIALGAFSAFGSTENALWMGIAAFGAVSGIPEGIVCSAISTAVVAALYRAKLLKVRTAG